ncbi:MAG: DUF5666 domain-containing protein, partial [Pirellulaceae bacterium]
SYSGMGTQSFSRSSVNEVVFYGGNGDDWFKNNTNVKSRAFGHAGKDTLVGGFNDDRLRGGGDDDRMFGNGGNDYLGGDDGNDIIHGQAGNDRIFAGAGTDSVYGENGNDLIALGAGNDSGIGGAGDDSIYGDSGDDYIRGGSGDDTLAGQDDNDRILGDDGNDSMYGNAGDDSMNGGSMDDRIVGGDGSDDMFGSSGRDKLFGQLGDDSLFGGDDDDSLYGDEDNDDCYGGNGNDYVRGGSGMDRLYGQSGSDDLGGDDDNDDLYGGLDDDILRGGRGNDDYFDDSSDSVFDDSDDYSPDGDFELRGTVENLDTNAKTFTISGVTVNYTNAAVRTTLSNGAFVKAEGLFANGAVTAREIEAEDSSSHNFEARGVISNLDTNAQTFSFLGLTVNYSSANVGQTLADGLNVEVEGTLNGSTVLAHRVGDDHGGGGDHQNSNGAFELRAAIQNFNASNKTFTLLGITVNFLSQRGSLWNVGQRRVCKGADGSYSNGTITARQVELEDTDDDRDENIEARGEVQNLDTSASTFEFLGFLVDYSGADIDDAFNAGDSIEIRGWLEGNNISAERIRK